jgi:hypothetical protein
MSEIKVGDYVRTNKGNIGKAIDIFVGHTIANYHIEFQTGVKVKRQYLSNKTIIKHSPNIIDLIEIGDYVNGKLIHYVLENPKNGETIICYGNGKHIDNKHIKSIVTKEVFASAEYRVETD